MDRVRRSISLSLVPLFFFLIGFRLYLQSAFPVFGDEAYYFYWGHHFSGGYYDLPPMIGWWERFFTLFSDEPFWLRLPNLLAMLSVAFGMREWVSLHMSKSKAGTISLLWLLSPIPFLAVLVSHDVALMFFTFFSALLFHRGYLMTKPGKEFFFSGVLWGASFLSKYFAVFVIPFYLIWHFTRPREKRSILNMVYFLSGSAPFLFQHLYWNANHCWANFVFNLITRQKIYEGPAHHTFGFFVLYLLILATPVFWFDLFKTRISKWFKTRSSLETFFLGMWLVPISLFGITALMGRGQGLHWYFPYLPFFFLWLGLRYSERLLKQKLRMMMWLTYVLSMIVLSVLFFPNALPGKWLRERYPLDYQIAFRDQEWAEIIASELNTSIWGETDLVVADSYSLASVLDHQLHRYLQKDIFFSHAQGPSIGVWGPGSRFGRVFDWTINFRDYDKKNVAMISRSLIPGESFSRYFDEFRISQKAINGVFFWIYLGRGFHADKYVNEILKPAWEKFYPEFSLERFIPSRCELRGSND